MATTTIRELITTYLADFSDIVPEKHRAIETAICDELDTLNTSIANLQNSYLALAPRNIGVIIGLDIGGTNGIIGGDGSTTSASVVSTSNKSIVTVNFANEMRGTGYRVELFVESKGDADRDTKTYCPSFTPITSTQFQINIRESSGDLQNLRIHYKIYQNEY